MNESERSAATYRSAVLDAMPRLLGALDRDPLSPSAGSFDRDHWSWKFRDAPVMTLQMAIAPLATLWHEDWPGNPWQQNDRLLAWIELAIRETNSRQGSHGGFETIGPNTWDHGVTLAMCQALAVALDTLGDALPTAVRDRTRDVIARGTSFARRTAEDYAFISNHQALFALAYYRAAHVLGDPALERAGDECLRAIQDHQSAEGWYLEYGGPDPGYETLGLSYLARCHQIRHSESLLSSMHRSAVFLSHCVHPDGSLGGAYGSRHCTLYYPGGLEYLAATSPAAAGIAGFLRARLDARNVVTPATTDLENLPTLVHSYLEAARACAQRERVPDEGPLPAASLEGVVRFPDSGVTVAGTRFYYAVTNTSKGGVFRLFDKQSASLVADDAGLVLQSQGKRWSSQLLGCGTAVPAQHPDAVSSSARFARVKRITLTPLPFLVLRLLNLTIFRSHALGSLVRRRIIERLITKPDASGAFTLERSVRFLPDRVEVIDRLGASRPDTLEQLWRTRGFVAIHMGSANYFSSHEATAVLSPDPASLRDACRRTGQGIQRFAFVFAESSSPMLLTSFPDEASE